jgi:2-hydroxy-3-keto-5-methylthiopentenyl-1-phosphate phosphatase
LSAAAGRVAGVVLDFDGTVTETDIGDMVCARFAPPAWLEIDQRWVRGELSLQEAQRQMWALCRCQEEEALAYVQEAGRLRAGLDLLLGQAAEARVPVWLASGGFGFYIEALLGPGRLSALQGRWYNHASFLGGGVEVSFPHAALACARCAICKGRVCEQARRTLSGPVAFVGDGYSDRCVLDHGGADRLFAVAGSALHRIATAQGVEVTPFLGLDEVAAALFL